MNLEEIKKAVDEGKTVHWSNDGYTVRKDRNGEYIICYDRNHYVIGLTWKDGITLNGEEKDFYIKK